MYRFLLVSLLTTLFITATAQNGTVKAVQRPKLVVGLVIDQMRWDFLYRYADRYGKDGFRRLLREGFTCENTMIPYAPTVTACGHTCVYTGSVPAIHGITGNAWWDNQLGKGVYCSEDKTVKTVGSSTDAGQMSPVNMLTTTITDELRIASNFKSKVIGIAIKDRGAILPAGHSANAAYWYDGDNGNWITSTYYMKELPAWVSAYNNRRVPDSLMALNWPSLYNAASYFESTADEKSYEAKFSGESGTSFPHRFDTLSAKKKYGLLRATPHGNTLTLQFAKAAMEAEKLGQNGNTDFLAISCSSTDYVGHQFGPNSMENEDDYLRLDKELALFLQYLDAKVGKGNYLFFLTADHGVAHVPGFMTENKLPGKAFNDNEMMDVLNERLSEKFGAKKIITATHNYQLSFNHKILDSLKINRDEVVAFILPLIKKTPGIANAFDIQQLNNTTLPPIQHTMFGNGYFANRCGEIQFVLLPGWIDNWMDGGRTGTTHGLWNPYDTHIPLLWFGWGIKQGKLNRETYMTDIAPTLSALLHIQMPNGSVGKPITEAMK